ncbi:cation diffusion facilitator family transporter [Notoacmeibacter ruber]|uniref:Cation diffusion facilitator family transporter n=1 Tax=Notoacmeibacter ruber TaxID=2670375 RepID=A0A3L7JBM6_9HYPH|nr:cation diffusion facilitator family transporter [Notoacmeibacter ruber]RLQ87844.1 cation diffusion facilitator family transporter [Notoacmeibacter ruber]
MKNPRKSEGANDGSESTGAVLAALFANLGIAITKFIAAALSGSASMLAEGFHSLVDTANQGFLLIGIHQSKKPADERHPFGYGNALYFWAFVVAIFLFSLGCGFSIYEGVTHLLHDEAGVSGDGAFPTIAVAVLVIAFLFEGYSWSVAFRNFERTRAGRGFYSDLRDLKDPAVFVVLAEDTAACIGIVIAAAGVLLSWYTAMPVFDGAASILIGIILGIVAIILAIEVKALLIGETADPDVLSDIRQRMARHPEIVAVNELRSMHLGPRDILLATSLDFQNEIKAGRIEQLVSEMEEEIRRRHPMIRKLYFEVQSAAGHRTFADQSNVPSGVD